MPPRCLITAGPTREYFDPVRYITNPSSGKMGYAIAAAARDAGCHVELVTGPVAIPPPDGVRLTRILTAAQMLDATETLFPACDILIKTAAVCDFRPRHYQATKVKKENVPATVEFEPVPDILKTLAARKTPGQTLVGFAAETNDIETYALRKLREKNLDLIVANQVAPAAIAAPVDAAAKAPFNAFESDDNHVILLGHHNHREEYGPAPKTEIARWLIAKILAYHQAR